MLVDLGRYDEALANHANGEVRPAGDGPELPQPVRAGAAAARR